MPLITAQAGTRITAAAFNASQNLFGAIKPSDQSVTSSTVFVNDSALFIPSSSLVANGSYLFICDLFYEGGVQGASDLKWQWILPAGASMLYAGTNFSLAGAFGQGVRTNASQTAGSNGAGNKLAVLMNGVFIMSTTLANLQLQWAQNTSSATATIVHANSNVNLQRLS
jgi:hypothetical protein